MTMQAELAIHRQLQKTFKTAQTLDKSWREIFTSLDKVETVCNLAEQLQCCDQVNVENTQFNVFPDLKNKLRYKLCGAIEVNIEQIQQQILPVQELVTKLSKQSRQCMELCNKYASDLTVDRLTLRSEVRPSIVDMLEWIQDIERTYRLLLASKIYLLGEFEYDKEDCIEKFKKGWNVKCLEMSSIPGYLLYVNYFMQEKF